VKRETRLDLATKTGREYLQAKLERGVTTDEVNILELSSPNNLDGRFMAAAVYDIGKLDVGLVTCFGHLSSENKLSLTAIPRHR
jgi:hypothetical protein